MLPGTAYRKDKHAPVINILKGNDVCCMARHASNMQSCLLCAAPFVYRSLASNFLRLVKTPGDCNDDNDVEDR